MDEKISLIEAAEKTNIEESAQSLTVEGININSNDAECDMEKKHEKVSKKDYTRLTDEPSTDVEDHEEPWREDYFKVMSPSYFWKNLYVNETIHYGYGHIETVKRVNHHWLKIYRTMRRILSNLDANSKKKRKCSKFDAM